LVHGLRQSVANVDRGAGIDRRGDPLAASLYAPCRQSVCEVRAVNAEHRSNLDDNSWVHHLGLTISLFSQVDVSDFQDGGAKSPHPQELRLVEANG